MVESARGSLCRHKLEKRKSDHKGKQDEGKEAVGHDSNSRNKRLQKSLGANA